MIYLLNTTSCCAEICRTQKRDLQTVFNNKEKCRKKMSINDEHKHLITYLYYRIRICSVCSVSVDTNTHSHTVTHYTEEQCQKVHSKCTKPAISQLHSCFLCINALDVGLPPQLLLDTDRARQSHSEGTALNVKS